MKTALRAILRGRMSTVAMGIITITALDCAPLSSTLSIQPSECERYRSKELEVHTRDGRMIRFAKNAYVVRRQAQKVEIDGKGMLYWQNGMYVGRPFEGHIGEDEIEEISVVQRWDPARFAAIMALACIIIPLAYYGW